MVQEFHVLRCFSCQTFQVQQVKKSKKWSCKMCGEKQSLIKEYGRGTGADCRRHVQKLNSLRGELLAVENERAWTQWEKEEVEECEVEVGPEDETRSWEKKVQAQVVSRWSKYVDQKENKLGCDEDEEEESVYTDTEQSCQHNNISRKRKKSFTSGGSYGHYTADGDEDAGTAHWGPKRLPSQHCPPKAPDSTYTKTNQRTDALYNSPAATCSESTRANKHASAELSTKPQRLVPLSSFFAPPFSHQHPSASKREANDSKWARFLPSFCDDDDVGESSEHTQYVDKAQSALTRSPVMPVATGPLKNPVCVSSGGNERALLDKVIGVVEKSVFEKPSQHMNGNVCKQPNGPTITSTPVGSLKPVRVQPQPIKRPCPALSFSTLFHTDEDFDDTY